jgi:hypothetical protein
MKTSKKEINQKENLKVENNPKYEPPAVKTYTEGEIMEELGPARTSPSNNVLPINQPPTQ